jgi:hypothetical protein
MGFKVTLFRFVGLLVLGLVLGACGPITDEDLQKWSHNEEGFKMMNQVVNDPQVPFETKVRALTVLVENGAGEKIRGMVRDNPEQAQLVSTLADKLLEYLKGTNQEFTARARDTMLSILAMLDDQKRDMIQKELATWAFSDIKHEMTKDEVWAKVQNRISFPQVRELEKYSTEAALIMIEKGLETREFSIFDWIDFLLAFQDKALTERTLASLKISHNNLFAEMKVNKDAYFRRQDLIILEKFYNMPAVLYLLELSEHPDLDRGTQMEALVRAHELFDKVIPENEKVLHADKLIPVMLRRMPLLNGSKRVDWATEILARSGFTGLDKVSMFDEEKDGKGEVQKTLKVWMSRKYLTVGGFLYGVMGDYLDTQINSQAAQLKKQWEKDGRWPPAAPAAAPAPEGQAAAPAEVPDINTDPVFKKELAAALDATLLKELKANLEAKMIVTRLFALAGLKHLGTDGAVAALAEVKAKQKDVSALGYFEKATLGSLADGALASVELAREFLALKAEMEEKQQLPGEHLDIIRRQMMSDMGLTPDELRKTFTEKIEKQKEKVDAYKNQFKEQLDKYHRYIKIICSKQVTEYPSLSDGPAVEAFIAQVAAQCESEAKAALNEKKLTLFKFSGEHYRAAVVLAIKKKEEVRKRGLRARVRAYLRVATEAFSETGPGKATLARTKVWKLEDGTIRKIIDRVVSEAFKMAKDAAASAPEDKKGRIGLTQADIDEYATMEVAEGYVLASMAALNWKLEWAEKGPDGGDRSWSYAQAEAAKRFGEGYWSDKALLDFFMNDIDASYAAFTLAMEGLDAAARSWGFASENLPTWNRVQADLNSARDAAMAAARTASGISEGALEAYLKYAPVLEMMTEVMVMNFDGARRKAMEAEEAAKAAEAAKAEEAAKAAPEAAPAPQAKPQ